MNLMYHWPEEVSGTRATPAASGRVDVSATRLPPGVACAEDVLIGDWPPLDQHSNA